MKKKIWMTSGAVLALAACGGTSESELDAAYQGGGEKAVEMVEGAPLPPAETPTEIDAELDAPAEQDALSDIDETGLDVVTEPAETEIDKTAEDVMNETAEAGSALTDPVEDAAETPENVVEDLTETVSTDEVEDAAETAMAKSADALEETAETVQTEAEDALDAAADEISDEVADENVKETAPQE